MTHLSRALAIIVLSLLVTSASHAQTVLIPGSLRGLGTMGPGGAKRLCAPLSIGLYEWQIGWVTRLLKPTESQAVLLRQLAEASARARQSIAAACGNDGVPTTIGQLDLMERRLEGLTEAVTLIRPSYELFYASLDDQQKARLEALGPARKGWRW
ncbi:MAG: hypothetical protein JWR89_1119 [Tardiphaga sp.]|jgi:hypothetical protein|uniref:Spy/CpxP family protein refolding chaperone n=1 Tax=Tardiphaga sp. TaxID=1926292 RepID=UPI002606EAD0|nr:Spy/CpxP family protein refolding chaperone [Tardiphaga sp.]MDB5501217.1 hypothetical protein [Tardiphaga sp.]